MMLKKKTTGTKERGFTLVELLIVVAIISVLAAIGGAQFSTYRKKSFNAAATSDLKAVKTYLEVYVLENKYYPY